MTNLTLLPGWGFNTTVLQDLASNLTPSFNVELRPLPDFSQPNYLEKALEQLPQNCWLVGWSLGGMLAALLAQQLQERCAGIILLCTNCSFVAKQTWPQAMPPATFKHFKNVYQQDAAQALKQFAFLCSQGALQPRSLLQQLQQHLSPAPTSSLHAGLDLLASLDIHGALQSFAGAKLAIFAQQDALVPATAAPNLAKTYPQITCQSINGSHAFVVEQAPQLATLITEFITNA